ncbi:MAG TPA: DNA polymerase Y family protein, partial [Flavipsychrobacter sp.]
MCRRFVAIWFYHLLADWVVRRNPELKDTPFVLAAPERGRMVIKATNTAAQAKGIYTGMVVADCRAILPSLQVLEDIPGKAEHLLNALAGWCIRYTPVAGIDLPDGLILDVSGCTHLWGGEQRYMEDITKRLNAFGYNIKIALADTIGAAWAVARYGRSGSIIEPGRQAEALMPLHPAALRLEPGIVQRLEKLGLYKIETFIKLPASALRRRFGQSLLTRLGQALGQEIEVVAPVQPPVPYQERLPCLEPIRTPAGIEIALQKLLETLCQRLQKEGKGLRKCVL